MKKLMAILLALVLVASLCACDAGGGTATDKPGSGNPVVKIGVFEPASGDNGAGGICN